MRVTHLPSLSSTVAVSLAPLPLCLCLACGGEAVPLLVTCFKAKTEFNDICTDA